MALSYDDMMFEYVLNNTENSKLTHKKSIKKNSKNIKISTKTIKSSTKTTKSKKEIVYFDNTVTTYKKVSKLYKNYKYIYNFYNLLANIVNDTDNDSDESRKHIYLTSIMTSGVYNSLLYSRVVSMLLCSNEFADSNKNVSLYSQLKKIYNYIKNDNITPNYLENNKLKFINFFEKNTQNDNIIIDNFTINPLVNDNFITNTFVKVIDIFNRYFNYLSEDYEKKKIGFYIANNNNDFSFKFSIMNKKNEGEINDLINTINYYFKEKISYINTFYQSISNIDNVKKSYNIINKVNLIINYGYHTIINNDIFLDYIENNLIDGGAVILFLTALTPIKSILIKKISSLFKKIIITKSTLDAGNHWVLICKGYNINKNKYNSLKIDNFINNSFNLFCKKIDDYLKNSDVIHNLSNKELVKEINKRYVEIYRWTLKNNIPVINIFSDENKKPELLKKSDLVNYLFPNQKGINKFDIKLFNVSIYSVTPPIEAKKISDMIKNIFYGFFKYNIHKINNLCITDGTANVGGNTINFSDNFNKVNTIEIEDEVFNALKHNCINVYNRKNINFYLGSCLDVIPKLKQDIIFIDPPWNGALYKSYDNIHLFLGNTDIIDIIKEWYNKKYAKLYIIKCPANLDFEPFIKNYKHIFIEKLKNYNVIYIINVN